VYLVLLATALAILASVVAVAKGRGGEIARSRRDLPVLPPRIRSASDVARLQLPIGLLGYSEQATDDALDAAARLIDEQEAEIARLREEVWRLRPQRNQETLADGVDGDAQAEVAVDESPFGPEDKTPSPDPVGGQPWPQM
jgi:hypothetical protein